MTGEPPSHDMRTLAEESRRIWEQNAVSWDAHLGEGDMFRRELIYPTVEPLLDVQPGELVLDIACGNGAFSRRMAQRGARVVAFDFSERLIELARARTSEPADRIEYRVLDASDEEHLLDLGAQRFDAAVCNMALQDMATLTPLASALRQLLKPGGRFVLSVTHPCFNSKGSSLLAEREDREGELVTTHSLRVFGYLGLVPQKGAAYPSQAAPIYCFDRPFNVLFRPFFEAGLVMDALEEPALRAQAGQENVIGWGSLPEIPPVLVARLRVGRP